MLISWTCAAELSLALVAAALAEEEQTTGWYLEEFESGSVTNLFPY